jgi:predicted ABC-type transport system involved in lysophospholipase L1 biosynthesis ATPase subunit
MDLARIPNNASSAELVRLRGVERVFDEGRIVALAGVDVLIRAGECVAILGRSGSGKSCLVNLLIGIDLPTAGIVAWRGSIVRSRRDWTRIRHDEVGIVFQDFNLLPTLTAAENVEIALFGRGLSERERCRRAVDALARVGLADRAGHLPNAMSGGERQRVAVARSLVESPALIVADEPTGNLDSVNGARIADLLFDVRRELGTALVVVTHDDALAARFPRRIRLQDGRIVENVSGAAEATL